MQLRTQAQIASYSKLPGAPALMTMWPTYYAYPKQCSDFCCNGCVEYFGWLTQAEVVPTQGSTGFPVIYEAGVASNERNVAGGKCCYIDHAPQYSNKTCPP